MDTVKKTTDAQKKAHQKYMEKYVEVKVRMTPSQRDDLQQHAARQHESATAFINRAIAETMERDKHSAK